MLETNCCCTQMCNLRHEETPYNAHAYLCACVHQGLHICMLPPLSAVCFMHCLAWFHSCALLYIGNWMLQKDNMNLCAKPLQRLCAKSSHLMVDTASRMLHFPLSFPFLSSCYFPFQLKFASRRDCLKYHQMLMPLA